MESLSEAASPCWVCPPHCTPRLHWGWSSCSILPCCKSSPSLQSVPPASLLKIFQHKWNQLSKISCRHLFAFTKLLTLGKTNARTPSILVGGAGELRQFNANWGRITTNNDNEDNANENNDNENINNEKTTTRTTTTRTPTTRGNSMPTVGEITSSTNQLHKIRSPSHSSSRRAGPADIKLKQHYLPRWRPETRKNMIWSGKYMIMSQYCIIFNFFWIWHLAKVFYVLMILCNSNCSDTQVLVGWTWTL